MAVTIEKYNNDNIVLTVFFNRALYYEIVMSIACWKYYRMSNVLGYVVGNHEAR